LFSLIASPRLSRRQLVLIGTVAGLAFAVLFAGSARAATSLINTDPCDGATLTQPFLPWGDSNQYKLVPGGDFNGSAPGWTLSGGAKLVSGGEPFGVTGKVSSSSIDLPAGSSVQSPFTCVDAAYPFFRLFAKNNSLLSVVAVSVVYKEPLLGQTAVPVGVIALTPNWAPTAQFLTASVAQGIVSALISGTNPQVALRFTSVTGSTQIDDVFVDPHMAH
jgi:hypothetical protein